MAAEQNDWAGDDRGDAVLYSYSRIPIGERHPMSDSAGDSSGDEHDHSNRVGEGVVSTIPVPSSASGPESLPVGSDEYIRYSESSWPISGQGFVRSSRDAWPHVYRRALTMAFNGAVFALGLFLGVLAPGPADWPFLSPHTALSQNAHSPVTMQHASSDGAATSATSNAPFAIATLRVHCMLSPCAETQYVPAGQRVYATQGDVTCTTTNAVEVVGQRREYVYCRLDQPGTFTYTFDGSQFDCVGSWLGCHNVVEVDMTNGRSGVTTPSS